MKSNTHINSILILITSMVFIFLVPWFTYIIYDDHNTKAEHQKYFVPFNKFLSNHPKEFKFIKNDRPYIRGKILVIDGFTNKADDVYFNLPYNLKARDTSEIGTYLRIFHKEDITAVYGNNQSYSIQKSCVFDIIDLKLNAVIFDASFIGSKPLTPDSKTSRLNNYGSDPIEKLISYINTLPIK